MTAPTAHGVATEDVVDRTGLGRQMWSCLTGNFAVDGPQGSTSGTAHADATVLRVGAEDPVAARDAVGAFVRRCSRTSDRAPGAGARCCC